MSLDEILDLTADVFFLLKYVRRDLSSMQRKTAKEAWQPKCAAPRLVHDSALSFETFMHVATSTYNTLVSNSISSPEKSVEDNLHLN